MMKIAKTLKTHGIEPVNLPIEVQFYVLDWKAAAVLLGYDPNKLEDEGWPLKGNLTTLVRDAPNNSRNRPFSMSSVKRYAEDILAGNWLLNGETMTFDKKGKGLSYQHRCAAIILAERMLQKAEPGTYTLKRVEIPSILIEGIKTTEDVADTVDTGVSRKHSDVLFRRHLFSGEIKASGYTPADEKKLSADLAVAARLVWLRVNGGLVAGGKKFPFRKMKQFIADHPRLQEAVAHVYAEDKAAKGISALLSRGYAAGLMYLFAHANSDHTEGIVTDDLWNEASEFWSSLAHGIGLEKGSPVLALKDRLVKLASEKGSTDRDTLCGLCIKAWEAYSEGKSLEFKDLRLKKDEEPRVGGIDLSAEVLFESDEPEDDLDADAYLDEDN